VMSPLHAATPAASTRLAARADADLLNRIVMDLGKGYGVRRMLKPMLRGFGSAANSIPSPFPVE
jgi:hypothetical protein